MRISPPVQKLVGPHWSDRRIATPAGYFTTTSAQRWLDDTLAKARRGKLPGQVVTPELVEEFRDVFIGNTFSVQPLAVSSGVAAAYVVLIFGLLFGPMVITALKGQWALLAAGWVTFGTVWMIAALRLARPKSWWARRFYSPGKLARSQARYETASAEPGTA
jgi:hypothetical protein